MKWKIIFLMTGGLLFVQASVAQKSVTDTVRLTFNIDSIGLDEVVVRGKRLLPPIAGGAICIRWN